jgi:hypothetical protein
VIANNQMSNMNTQTEHQWNEKDTKLIDDYRNYFYNCMIILEELYKNGPAGIEFPKKPKGSLQQLLVQEIKDKQQSVNELQTFLESHLVTNSHYFSMIINVSPIYLSNLDSLKSYLQTGYQALKKQNAITLGNKLDFGNLLIEAFELFELKKLGGELIGTWKDWVTRNVGISDRYERQLREMSRILSPYPKFKQLGIPFDTLWRNKKQVEYHLKCNREFANFWKQV